MWHQTEYLLAAKKVYLIKREVCGGCKWVCWKKKVLTHIICIVRILAAFAHSVSKVLFICALCNLVQITRKYQQSYTRPSAMQSKRKTTYYCILCIHMQGNYLPQDELLKINIFSERIFYVCVLNAYTQDHQYSYSVCVCTMNIYYTICKHLN